MDRRLTIFYKLPPTKFHFALQITYECREQCVAGTAGFVSCHECRRQRLSVCTTVHGFVRAGLASPTRTVHRGTRTRTRLRRPSRDPTAGSVSIETIRFNRDLPIGARSTPLHRSVEGEARVV
jgi:hypothetical protein